MTSSTTRRRVWSAQRLEQWQALRARGRRHFIWAYGVLRWGGVMFFFSTGVFNYAHFGQVISLEGNWGMRTLLGLLTWTFVGYGYGHSQWRRNEQIFRSQVGIVTGTGDFQA